MKNDPKFLESDVVRPYVISVDADIPPGTSIKITSAGKLPGGTPWSEEFINPVRVPFSHAWTENLGPVLLPSSDGLATPFLYAIVVEGDRRKQVIDAEALALQLNLDALGLVMMRPKDERPFLTTGWQGWPHTAVSRSNVTRPYVFEINGHASDGSKILFSLSGLQMDGSSWQVECSGPCRRTLPVNSLKSFQFNMSLHSSPDTAVTPSLNGIALEGDGRRYFLSVADFAERFGEKILEQFQIFKLSEDESVLILRPVPPKFQGPPSVLHRLNELFTQGKLRAESAGT